MTSKLADQSATEADSRNGVRAKLLVIPIHAPIGAMANAHPSPILDAQVNLLAYEYKIR
jgi:hypothetical protein